MERGPCWPPLSVAIRLLIAIVVDQCRVSDGEEGGCALPFDETPAPISISGSSTTIPGSIGLPPVPPYSADNIHLRSASVRRSRGMMLIPV